MLAQDLDAIVLAAADRGAFSGVALVARGEEILCHRAVGLANRSWELANTLDTRFRVASVSKMFTAVLVLDLVARGQLALDEEVLPRLGLQGTALPPEIQVQHLLTMTAGIADFLEESEGLDASWEAMCRACSITLLRAHEDYLPLFVHRPPRAPVGERHAYSNASYILLGLLLERVSGRPYAELLRGRVLEPAGMRESGFFAVDDVEPRVAEGYLSRPDGGWRRNVYELTPAPMADGGVYATAADLARFLRALAEGRLLHPEWTRAMLTPRVVDPDDAPRDGARWFYGYGVYALVHEDGRVLRYGHTGEEPGASARAWTLPEQDARVVVLGNQDFCAGELARLLLDRLREG